MIAGLVLHGFLGPLVVVGAVVLGGLCLRLVDRLGARNSARPRRRRARGAPQLRALVRPDLIAEGFKHGAPMRWTRETEERFTP